MRKTFLQPSKLTWLPRVKYIAQLHSLFSEVNVRQLRTMQVQQITAQGPICFYMAHEQNDFTTLKYLGQGEEIQRTTIMYDI